MTPGAVASLVAGVAIVVVVLWDAFETVLVPRRIARRVRLTRYFYMLSWRAWRAVALAIRRPTRREALLGFFGPLSLILLLGIWAVGLIVAFALMQLAAGGTAPSLGRFVTLLYMSGETFFTLGYGDVTPATGSGMLLSVLEAGLGFAFLATVLGYLPTMYTAFAQREIEISLLDASAGSPPTAAEFHARMAASGDPALRDGVMRGWERWSAQLLETHISYPQLSYYRSQHGNQSWLGALTAILDSSALVLARGEAAPTSQAGLTFAMARHALVDITQIFIPRFPAAAPDRLPDATLARLRQRLPEGAAAGAEVERRLAELRILYEPYAQALAAFLLFDLPPWVHAETRRDNWRGGPWDRRLAAREEPGGREEHF